MIQDLKGKVALITGAGKKTGIGYGIAHKLASCGADIIISDLGRATQIDGVKTGSKDDMEKIAEELARKFTVKTMAVCTDITSSESIMEMKQSVQKHFGSVDILCNNAGAVFGTPSKIHDYNEEAWMKSVDMNLHSVFRVSQAIIPLMMENGGSIINLASRAEKAPYQYNGAYAASKAGVIMMSKVMALELAEFGIRVNAICPGQILTELLEKRKFGLEAQLMGTTVESRKEEMRKTIPLGRLGEPEDIAGLAAFLASDSASYMTGQAVNVCGGQLMEL